MKVVRETCLHSSESYEIIYVNEFRSEPFVDDILTVVHQRFHQVYVLISKKLPCVLKCMQLT